MTENTKTEFSYCYIHTTYIYNMNDDLPEKRVITFPNKEQPERENVTDVLKQNQIINCLYYEQIDFLL